MKTLERSSHAFLTEDESQVTETGVTFDVSSTDNIDRDNWQAVLDDKLISWGSDRDQFEDPDLAPSDEVLAKAARLADMLSRNGFKPPRKVFTDGDGGVVYEWRSLHCRVEVHVWDDCSIEAIVFAGGKVVDRTPIAVDN